MQPPAEVVCELVERQADGAADTTRCQESEAEARQADRCDDTPGTDDHHVIGVDVIFVRLGIVFRQEDAA